MNNQAFTALDAGLQALGELSPEYGAELSDHAPMVLEALDRLEASAAIAPFLARTLPKLRKLNAVAEPGLGNYEQLVAQASEELLQKGGPQVLLDWFPRYAPGLAGAAFHGLIRLAHAQRSLARASSASAETLTLRRAELAKALAYACVRAQVLAQAEAPAEAPRLGLQQALRELEPSPPWRRMASCSVVARPSWRKGAVSASPQSGRVRNSLRAIPCSLSKGSASSSPMSCRFRSEKSSTTADPRGASPSLRRLNSIGKDASESGISANVE